MSSPEYKRKVAGGLAEEVTKHHKEHPDDPIYLAGLSAGCAVVLYALEELPEDVAVDQVILLSSSVSSEFDLTRALQRVRGRIYAFTSDRDVVLGDLAANFGTADGKKVGTDISGLTGFHRRGEPRAQFVYGGKVQNIAWRTEFAQYGHHGGHTDSVATPFVARYVAPLVIPADRSGKPGEHSSIGNASEYSAVADAGQPAIFRVPR
jgi:pimeloyl-ACP methyl ester carboxylesterase